MSTLPKQRLYIGKDDGIAVYENNLVTLTTASGDTYAALEPRRLFPIHDPDRYITLLTLDGKEVGIIRELSDLNDASRTVIENSLNDFYLVPHILAVLSITEKSGTLHWTVRTNRGEKQFDIRNRNHDIRLNSDGSIRVRDADDNRYLIPDYRTLDKHSLRLLASDL